MKAAVQHCIQRVVMTSSTAAVLIPEDWDGKSTNIDPSMWADVSKKGPNDVIVKSKVKAEKTAISYSKYGKSKIELVTILPGLVVGPCIAREKNFSCDLDCRRE